MKLDTMYAGKPYSPATTLAQPCTETATDIYVTDGSVLPDAPNIAVLGIDENGETILYRTKSGTLLGNVQRGIQDGGVGKSWPIGSTIARNITEYDFQKIIGNILKMNNELGNTAILINATATYADGVFLLSTVQSLPTDYFILRFVTPEDYHVGDTLQIGGEDYDITTIADPSAPAPDGIFSSGALITADVDVVYARCYIHAGTLNYKNSAAYLGACNLGATYLI